jgi:hypothetical protein
MSLEGLVGQGGQPMSESPSYYGNSDPTARMVRMPTLKDRLNLAVAQAEEKLASVKRAKEIFDKNPDLEELLNIMQKSHF